MCLCCTVIIVVLQQVMLIYFQNLLIYEMKIEIILEYNTLTKQFERLF